MQNLPALSPTPPCHPQHLRWIGRLPIRRLRTAGFRLAQSVVLSGTASLIVVAAQHRMNGLAIAPSTIEAPKQSAAVIGAAVRKDEGPASAESIAGTIAPVTQDPAPAPPRLPVAVPAGRDAGRTRTAESWVPLPPRPPIRAAARYDASAQGAPTREAVAPGPFGPMAEPKLIRTAAAVPLPPLKAIVAQAKPRVSQASQDIAPPIRMAAGSSVPSGSPTPLAVATARTVPPSARHPSADVPVLVAPVRYGMRLALGVGDFVMAANYRLLSGTADAIGSLVR